MPASNQQKYLDFYLEEEKRQPRRLSKTDTYIFNRGKQIAEKRAESTANMASSTSATTPATTVSRKRGSAEISKTDTDINLSSEPPSKKRATKPALPKKATKPTAPKKASSRTTKAPSSTITAATAATTNDAAPPTSTKAKTTVVPKFAAGGASKKAANPMASKKAKASASSTTKKTSKKSSTTSKVTKPTATKGTRAPKVAAAVPPPAIINEVPSSKLDVWVFGEGSSGELALGRLGKVTDVKRPRLNPRLSKEFDIVQISTGGMHCAALTREGKVLTWGVNDQGALGRDTKWDEDAGLAIPEEEGDDREDETDMNPLECNAREVDTANVPVGTVFAAVAAGDSVTLALTTTGLVFGCGTFRSNEGILGFSSSVYIQQTLVQIPNLSNIVKVCCGDNHCMALGKDGNAYAWGSGQQNQLGRRIVERSRMAGLTPGPRLGLPKGKVVDISCGAYHSFALDKSGSVYAWGLNSYGETGLGDSVGDDNAVIINPHVVSSLEGKQITSLAGAAHHSLAVDSTGQLYAWGRLDGSQTGLDLATISDEAVIKDEHGKARIVTKPTLLPATMGSVVIVSCGTDTSIAVNAAGKAFAWGFSANYQTGLGTEEDVAVPTMIDNTAVRERTLTWCGMGGQFGMLAALAAV